MGLYGWKRGRKNVLIHSRENIRKKLNLLRLIVFGLWPVRLPIQLYVPKPIGNYCLLKKREAAFARQKSIRYSASKN